MGIWIRTQDKEMLMNCNAIGIGLEDDKSIYSNGYVLGTYSTKEKALKVLDMMELKIDDIEYKDIRGSFVFQMPQDKSL